MNIAVMCNQSSALPTERAELIEMLSDMGHNVFQYGIQEELTDDSYARCGAEFVGIYTNRTNINPLRELMSLLKIPAAVKKKKIDRAIIYGVKNHPTMVIGAWLGGVKRIVSVVNGRGNLFTMGGMKGRIIRALSFPLLKIAYGLSYCVCFQNEEDREMFLEKHLIGKNKKTIVTNGSGVNLGLFPQKPMNPDNRFLYLSRITPTKGLTEFCRAAEAVKLEHPEASFDVVGYIDGNIEASYKSVNLQQTIKQFEEKGIIKYHGPTAEVPAWMESCRFFIYPSYYPEGVPRCIMQAMATGRPIVTSNSTGCRDTVEDGENGFRVPSKDYKKLAEKMNWLIENPAEAEEMGQRSRKLAEQKFNVYDINAKLINKLLDDNAEKTAENAAEAAVR